MSLMLIILLLKPARGCTLLEPFVIPVPNFSHQCYLKVLLFLFSHTVCLFCTLLYYAKNVGNSGSIQDISDLDGIIDRQTKQPPDDELRDWEIPRYIIMSRI